MAQRPSQMAQEILSIFPSLMFQNKKHDVPQYVISILFLVNELYIESIMLDMIRK